MAIQKVSALEQLQANACKIERAAGIARMLGVPGKTLRERIRSGALFVIDDDGKRVRASLPGVKVSESGVATLTDAHKRACVTSYVTTEEQAQAILDGNA